MRRSRQRSKALLALKRLFLASNQVWQAPIHPSYSNTVSKLVTQPFWILLPFQLYMAHRIFWFYLLKHGTEFFTSTTDCSYFSNLKLQTSVVFSVLLNVFQGQNLSVASQINYTDFTLVHWPFQRNKAKKIHCIALETCSSSNLKYQSNNKRANDNYQKFAKKWIRSF